MPTAEESGGLIWCWLLGRVGEDLTGPDGLRELLTKTVPKCRWPESTVDPPCFDGSVLELREYRTNRRYPRVARRKRSSPIAPLRCSAYGRIIIFRPDAQWRHPRNGRELTLRSVPGG